MRRLAFLLLLQSLDVLLRSLDMLLQSLDVLLQSLDVLLGMGFDRPPEPVALATAAAANMVGCCVTIRTQRSTC